MKYFSVPFGSAAFLYYKNGSPIGLFNNIRPDAIYTYLYHDGENELIETCSLSSYRGHINGIQVIEFAVQPDRSILVSVPIRSGYTLEMI